MYWRTVGCPRQLRLTEASLKEAKPRESPVSHPSKDKGQQPRCQTAAAKPIIKMFATGLLKPEDRLLHGMREFDFLAFDLVFAASALLPPSRSSRASRNRAILRLVASSAAR
jgi:hypothetical protein